MRRHAIRRSSYLPLFFDQVTALSFFNAQQFASILLVTVLISILGCGPSPVLRPPPNTEHSVEVLPSEGPNTLVFSVFIDGLDVGREVRSVSSAKGPFGPESLTLSHFFKRVSLKSYDFNHYTVRSELTLASDGTFLRGSYVVLNSLSGTVVSQVGFTGDRWDRIKEFRESVSDPISQLPTPLPLVGTEVIGFRLHDLMRDIAAGDKDFSVVIAYYNPWFDSSFLNYRRYWRSPGQSDSRDNGRNRQSKRLLWYQPRRFRIYYNQRDY